MRRHHRDIIEPCFWKQQWVWYFPAVRKRLEIATVARPQNPPSIAVCNTFFAGVQRVYSPTGARIPLPAWKLATSNFAQVSAAGFKGGGLWVLVNEYMGGWSDWYDGTHISHPPVGGCNVPLLALPSSPNPPAKPRHLKAHPPTTPRTIMPQEWTAVRRSFRYDDYSKIATLNPPQGPVGKVGTCEAWQQAQTRW